ncbi:hypothetical protein [Burkholderia ambifaria]|uniref:hypothetical protein n=1 Tax=Burkholderia ambifaria TaxID=152480 RepID=UPI00158D6E15|nr:hypothetical protein [Burkholderia ambifaria]MBR8344683.1 hypothetical protein [Burkholderia ambifaria]
MFEAARETLSRAVKARAEYEQHDQDRWAAAANPFEAWADYSARTPERNERRDAIRNAESDLRAISAHRGHAVMEAGEAA